MVDVFTRAQRSAVMARVLGRNTSPERDVRRALHWLGYRFRLSPQRLPGRPDVVLTKHRIVVFVHGCFWHQHAGCKSAARPESNKEYWNAKLDRNVARDRRNATILRKSGWRVVVIWECRIREARDLTAYVDRRVGHRM